MLEAIELMIPENLSLRQAASQLGIEITPQQADNIAGRIHFKDAPDDARLAGNWEDFKAADALLKLAKIQGWMGYEPDSLQKALIALTQDDINQLKTEIRDKRLRQRNPVVGDESPCSESHPTNQSIECSSELRAWLLADARPHSDNVYQDLAFNRSRYRIWKAGTRDAYIVTITPPYISTASHIFYFHATRGISTRHMPMHWAAIWQKLAHSTHTIRNHIV
jgi:hypothetical protein